MDEDEKDANIKHISQKFRAFLPSIYFLKSFQKSMLLNPIKFRKQGFEVAMKIARYVLGLLHMTGSTDPEYQRRP